MAVFLGAGVIVDVGQSVELVHHYVYVVAAYAVALAGDALAFVGAGDGVELTTLNIAFYCVEMGCNGVYSRWVTNEDYSVGKLFWTQMKMEAGAIFVDDEF